MKITSAKMGRTSTFYWMLLAGLTVIIWIPVYWVYFPTIGLGHDSQIFTPAVHAALRNGNTLWSTMPKIIAAREDIFSYPYFGLLYPFYGILGLEGEFTYHQHILFDFLSVAFHFVAASITFSYLLIRMACRHWVAAIFGIAYAYSMHLKLWSSWIWAFSGYSWIPLCLLGIWEIVVMKRARAGIFWLGLGFGLITLGTALPLVYALILSLLFYFSCLLIARPTTRQTFIQIKNLVIGGAIGLAVGASHLIPVLFRQSDYVRWYSGGTIVGGLKPPYSGTLDQFLALEWASIGQFFIPFRWSGNVGHLYIGSAIIFFAAYILFTNRNWRVYFTPLLIGAIYFYLDAFGDGLVVHRITYQIPLVSSIRYPLANAFIAIFALLLISAIGVNNALQKNSVFRSNNLWVFSLFILLLISFALQYFYRDSLLFSYRTTHFWWLFAPVIAIPLALLLSRLTTKPATPFVITFVLIAMLPQYSLLFHPKVPKVQNFYMSCTELDDLYKNLVVAKNEIGHDSRLSTHLTGLQNGSSTPCLHKRRMKFSEAQAQSLAILAGWKVQQIYISPRVLKEYKLLGRLMGKSKRDYNTLLNAGITHLLTDSIIANEHPLFKQLSLKREMGKFNLYEVNNYQLGLDNIGCLYTENGSLYHLSQYGSRELSGISPIPTNGLCKHYAPEIKSFPEIRDKIEHHSTIQFNINSEYDTIYLSDQVFSKDWKIYINDVKQPSFKLDNYRLAFLVPAGNLHIKIEFSPIDFLVGKYFTFIGSLLLIIIFVHMVYVKDKRPPFNSNFFNNKNETN